MDIQNAESALRQFFSTHASGIVATYLFGSLARGTANARSDVDVAVLYANKPPEALHTPPLDLEADLGRLLAGPVDVIVLNSAPADLVHRVLRDGRLLFEGDRSARIAFEVRARNEYFDLLPILRRYRRLERAGS